MKNKKFKRFEELTDKCYGKWKNGYKNLGYQVLR